MVIPELRPSGKWRDELARFASTLPAHLLLVEVGAFAGESAAIFLASGRVGLLVCVDEWSDDGNTFPPARHMAEAEREFDLRVTGQPVQKLKMTSQRAAELFADGSVDAVYIDADHRYASVAADLSAWRPKVKRGGIVAGHDWWIADVRRAVRDSFGREPDQVYKDGSPQGTWAYVSR